MSILSTDRLVLRPQEVQDAHVFRQLWTERDDRVPTHRQIEPELAIELLQAVHNQGYATEAARAVLSWSADAGYGRVWASVWEWNIASRRVLEKLGFVDSGQDGGPPSEYGRNILTVTEQA